MYRQRYGEAENKRLYSVEYGQLLAPGLEHQSLETLNDYADLNLRYLKATGLFVGRGRGIMIAPERRTLVNQLLAQPFQPRDDDTYLHLYWSGAPLPTDHKSEAKDAVMAVASILASEGQAISLPSLDALDIASINQLRFRLDEELDRLRETRYANEQSSAVEDITGYLEKLQAPSKPGQPAIPRDLAPAYLEWAVWRAFLAIDSLENSPWQARGFKLDPVDWTPVGVAPSRVPDMVFEFADFVLVVEVTLSTSSRQEAMEGEPVRRHVADVVAERADSGKPVFGLFIANVIDSNTAETLRIGSWYLPDGTRRSLRVVPLTLQQFTRLFVAGFNSSSSQFSPQALKILLLNCLADRTANAPQWKAIIADVVDEMLRHLKVS
jgi:hypothetical protein